ncbi:ATP-dependent DNA helicase [Sediminitomix flava]|uniref:Exodeoxyribonuclease-5 n=1 Tax=Sediminitomix flava TaxID=379075 RepID=A0A315Z6Q4_SEDFL|nr:AAA family ATPase [Sediminitomix flava]PWJ39324.1 exodeoxyribonuclease-5 [Sediminitomix flava]
MMEMNPSDYLFQQFKFPPTAGQAKLFDLLNEFILDKGIKRHTFLLRGYAGTGKTSTVNALVRVLRRYNYQTMLLAPTGRAAKVMSYYAKRRSYTIHKIIFKQTEDPDSGVLRFERQRNTSQNTIFIVDEASMINDQADMGNAGLLTELIQYVFQDPKSGNKLLLIGDTAQLPPVHQQISPALDAIVLEKDFHLRLIEHELTQVVRQANESGILVNATGIRQQLTVPDPKITLWTKSYKDVFSMTSERLEDGLLYGYDKFGTENTVIICRSNRQATQYNQYIRRQIHFREEELEPGDQLMIVRNNYHWLPEDSPAGFLANGEFIEVCSVRNIEEMHGHRFADISFKLLDYDDHPIIEAKVLLDTLHSFTPSLSQQENRELYQNVVAEYNDVDSKAKRMKMIRGDQYLNALQIKFSYALTCHKSQGGQWDAVFVDMGYLPNNEIDIDFLRWLYTATTRAQSELFFMNFPSTYFK